LSAWRRDGPVTLDKADQISGPNQFINLVSIDPEAQLYAVTNKLVFPSLRLPAVVGRMRRFSSTVRLDIRSRTKE
jgi:hypothetical protein